MKALRSWIWLVVVGFPFRSPPSVDSAQTGFASTVAGIELVSPHSLPQEQILKTLDNLTGSRASRGSIRESLDRLWALGLFSQVWVEEIAVPQGVQLRYHLERRPHIRAVRWEGDLGLDVADLAAAAGFATGEAVEPGRIAQARKNLLALYLREGYPAAEVAIEMAEDSKTNARDLTIFARAGKRPQIGLVQIEGTSQVSVALIRRAFGVKAGDTYREAVVREGVQKVQESLRKEKYFEATVTLGDLERSAETGRIELTLQIVEGRRFDFEFVGNKGLKESLLYERLTFPDVGVVDELEVQANARQIERLYRENGYHFVHVDASLNEEGATAKVRFQITEGPQVRVEAVDFRGQTAFPPARLQEQIQTRPRGYLSRGLFRQEIVDLDLAALQAFLRAEGFVQAAVGPARMDFSEDRSRVRMTIPIKEGPRLRVGRIAVEGATVLSAEEIMAGLPLREGEFWDRSSADRGASVIERLYAQRGYHAALVELSPERRDDFMDVVYRIREGTLTRIGQILLSGNVQTRDYVVLRDLPFRSGDPFNPEELIEGERRLGGLGLFEQVQLEPLRPSPRPFSDVTVTVREKKPWRLDFGLGFSTDEGLRGFLEVGHDNLFGTGRTLSLREKVSGRGDRTDLIYREPWLFGVRWKTEARLFREQREEIGFDLERIGMSFGAQSDLFPERFPGLRWTAGYRLERVRRFRVDPTLAAEDVKSGTETVGRLVSSLNLDRRDNPFDPKRGSYHLFSAELGAAAIGSDLNFFKSRLETHWFFDWLPPTVFAFSGRLGWATPLGATRELAIEDRFFAGGSTTVRGYRENRVGPLDAARNPIGGNALVIFNSEWRFPIWRVLGGALFFDVGAVASDIGELSIRDFRPGAGAGLRINTPVGPIRVDLGYALRSIPNEDRLQIYFSVGNPF